jgi:CRP-like cAMP-binding protein
MTQKLVQLKIPALSYLSDEQILKLQNCAVTLHKSTGQPIILAKEDVLGMFFVVDGEVGVYSEEKNEPIALLGPGEHIGEASLIDPRNQASMTIRSTKPRTELILVNKKSAAKLFEQDPDLAAALYRGIAFSLRNRLKAMNKKIRQIVGKRKISISNMVTPLDLLKQGVQTINTGKNDGKNRQSIRDGIVFALEDLSKRFPGSQDTISAILEDLAKIQENEVACFSAFEKQFTQTQSFLQQIDEILAAS